MSGKLQVDTEAISSAGTGHAATAEKIAGYEGEMNGRVGGLRVGSGSIGGVIATGIKRIAVVVIEDLPKAVSKAVHAMAEDHHGIADEIDRTEQDLARKAEAGGRDELARVTHDATGKADAAAAGAARVPGTNVRGQLTSRGSFRKATLQDAWDTAEPGPNGGRLCPTCGTEVKVKPGTGGHRDWDASHNPSWSNRDFAPTTTRKAVLDNYNKGVSVECPTCNRKGQNNDSRFGHNHAHP